MTDLQIAITAWTVVGFVLVALETVLPGMIVFMFGLGALCTALCVWLFGTSLGGQFAVFGVTSVLALVFLRRFFQQALHGKSSRADRISSITSLQGARGKVCEAIPLHGTGKVQARGSFWAAYADEALTVGTQVEVIEEKRPDEPRVKVARTE